MADDQEEEEHPYTITHEEPVHYYIQPRPSKRYPKGILQETIYEVSFNKTMYDKHLLDILKIFKDLLTDVLKLVKEDMKPNRQYLTRFFLNSPSLVSPLIIPPRVYEQMTPTYIMNEMGRVLQSVTHMSVNEKLIIHLALLQMPERISGKGGGRYYISNLDYNDLNSDFFKKKCFVNVHTVTKNSKSTPRLQKMDMCLARSLIVSYNISKYHNQVDKTSFLKKVKDSRRLYQFKLAKKLHEQTGVSVKSCGIDELKIFENFLKRQVVLFTSDGYKRIIYSGNPNFGKFGKLFIFLHNNHYTPIISPKALYCKSFFCKYCLKLYNTKQDHFCKYTCNLCNRTKDLCVPGVAKTCTECNFRFSNVECYDIHKSNNTSNQKSRCDTIKKCNNCTKILRGEELLDHKCFTYQCQNCKLKVPYGDHLCHVRSDISKKKEPQSIIFYDLETIIDKESRELGVDLAVARTLCSKCSTNDPKNDKCYNCGIKCNKCINGEEANCDSTCMDRQIIVDKGAETGDIFFKWLLNRRKSRIVSYNGTNFDNIFFLNFI